MAIAFDNQGSVTGAAVATLTTAAFTIAGANRIIVAGMGALRIAGTPTHTGMKWGGSSGTAMTQIGSTLVVNALYSVSFWYLIAPAASSDTLYGAISAAADGFVIGGCSYTGVDQSVPLGTSASASAGTNQTSPATATVDVSSAAGELVVDFGYAGSVAGSATSATVAVGAGQTMRWEQENILSGNQAATQSEEGGAATVTMSEVFTMNSDMNWGIFAVPMKPASGTTFASIYYRRLVAGQGA